MLTRDGYAPGSLVRFTIDDLGVIKGVFSNDMTMDLARIALATFPNQEGLVKQSDTLFTESGNSGPANVDAPGVGNRGLLIPGFLEMSNVDLSQEFTNLILAQRGFQANSRVITTSDEMLQELMTLKR
ncbi:MAG: flagellar hook-basal body complex protein [Limnochordaceae bacterium]|nr:flagellar hook-basal body complex protein [Limnochordaceae bacterium]